jgi:hypothetical protein
MCEKQEEVEYYFDFLRATEIIFILKVSWPAVGPTQRPTQSAEGLSLPGNKFTEALENLSPSPSSKGKNGCSYLPFPSYTFKVCKG